MRKIRFLLALWAGKFLLFIWKKTGRERDDRPGMAAMRLCEDFLEQVAKPPITVAVTGTNGKTSISGMVADMLRRQGKTVSYNDWGANHHAGQARCILDAVSIFNKPTKDAAIIESDELISPINFPRIKPNYIIVNNVARDSMLRNANPEYIASQLSKACAGTPDSVVIVNADDPICCFIGEKNRRIYFGAEDLDAKPFDNTVKDFSVCPECGAKAEYVYRNYRHIGQFSCGNCGLSTPERDYFAMNVSKESKTFTVKEKSGEYTYPIISDAVHNIYNTAAIVALMRDLGNSPEEIAKLLKETAIPQFRETQNEINGIEIICRAAKGQNATAVSTVFEQVSKDNCKKEIVVILDEIYENPKKQETVAWIYDTDYELLKGDDILRVIVAGPRCKDHLLRLLIAGVNREKIRCTRDLKEIPALIDGSSADKIYVLHDVNSVGRGHTVRDEIIEKISGTVNRDKTPVA